MSNLDKYKKDLDALIELGDKMLLDLQIRHHSESGELPTDIKEAYKKVKGSFEKDYQRWYTESSGVIKQLIPERYTEFEQLYKGEGKRKGINATNYSI